MTLMMKYLYRMDVEKAEEDTCFVDVGYCRENSMMIMQV